MLPSAYDYALKQLERPGMNIGGFIDKNVRICGSGLYTYHRDELSGMGLRKIPKEYDGLEYFNVYRPPEVLSRCKDMFARIPVTQRHPDEMVHSGNAHKYVKGLTGDSVESERAADGELYLYTTMTIFDGEAIEFYKRYKEVSCGYVPVLNWKAGVHKGRDYQITMVDMKDGNHLALCEEARGGRHVRVLDNKTIAGTNPAKEKFMNSVLFKAMFMTAGAKDSCTKFKLVLDSIDKPEKVKNAVTFAESLISVLPASDSRAELEANLKDFAAMDGLTGDELTKVRDYIRDSGCALLGTIKEGEAKGEAKAKDEAPAKAEAPAKDEAAALAKIVADAVAASIKEIFKDNLAGHTPIAGGGSKVDDKKAEDKKTEDGFEEKEKEEEEKKAKDGVPNMDLSKSSGETTYGGVETFSVDSIMGNLMGIKREEKK